MRVILIVMSKEKSLEPQLDTAPSVLDTSRSQADSVRRFSSVVLLQGDRQIVIEHAGREYRLRVTSQGKLILTA